MRNPIIQLLLIGAALFAAILIGGIGSADAASVKLKATGETQTWKSPQVYQQKGIYGIVAVGIRSRGKQINYAFGNRICVGKTKGPLKLTHKACGSESSTRGRTRLVVKYSARKGAKIPFRIRYGLVGLSW